ncbi:uncharacterized protein LOC113506168 [Trichoplusia ni]|uniref:Uncharacterized protein LOC113506168 n=1 Tax=Trichoplusia ni TaxID=7111 RepID=A0A7E5WVF3_TRINI|nr:uncharacterized protein LOC113506168 [Trichoplusia ni]
MLRESYAKNLVSTWSKSDLPVIRGFGNSIVDCIGKCILELKIDSVKASVEVLIIPDHLLQVPLLVGQTFTEQEHIVIYKTNSKLIISHIPTTGIHLYVSKSVTVKGLTILEVYSKPDYTGDVFCEPSLCQDPLKPYEITQSLIHLADSHGYIVIKGLSREFVLSKDSLLLRALPLNELRLESLNVKKIEHCPDNSNITRIEVEAIQVDPSIGSENILKLTEMLNNFRDCFAFSSKELGCITGTEMNIRLNNTTPVVYRPYRLSHSERQVVRDIVQELEDSDIIRESSSDYASPIVLVRKKSGDHRLCIDFRALNKITIKEHYPLPRIDDQLDNLSGYKYYTSLDLASGYYQIPLAEPSKRYTAFVTPDGHYEFNRMPFGLVNAPSTFQRTINNILGNARFKEAFAYMDDLHTDASKIGVAGIVLQRSNKESPFSAVAYYSRQTSPEESKLTSYDLETLAVVTSLQRFRED